MTILVAAHRAYPMPEDKIYQPIEVGADLHESHIPRFTLDNTGENISAVNSFYNELTATYWAKHNLQSQDVIGLAHYRRFLGRRMGHRYRDLLTDNDITKALSQVDVLLPRQRNYVIETQEQHYLNAHARLPYDVMYQVIQEKYPDYIPAFETIRHAKKAHLFNMFIMKQRAFQQYTDFLFGVLFEVEQRIDFSELTGQDQRALGFLGERLMDVWLLKNQMTYQEFPVVTTEKTNWLVKGWHFLKRHFGQRQQAKTHF
ncbi:DUF4422 domain-containing protein [Weissella diestrammenae]|uniref:DUF4422 domain-containing protein n=1 Tax=Weissella diestrammenae TaxID=1162633 RepID=A0A7G9T7N6_9LACO|nr:DUF4422 domain-containing protein [Weissella diestrammenae]MCM0583478.1 DUF4422 domain-containing protein [Weissella diestrammenae]QNN76111.1 DUF4422 domain-containing protein [Weissella diestrammenae]